MFLVECPAAPPIGISSESWARIQRSVELEEYAIVAGHTHGEGLRAVNRAHGFEARFDTRGLRLAPVADRDWSWGLSLTGWGRPDGLAPAAVEQLSAETNRV